MQGGRCRQVQTQLQAGRGLISGAEARGWDKAPGVLPLARGEVARQPRQPARGRLTTKGKTRIQAGKGVVLDSKTTSFDVAGGRNKARGMVLLLPESSGREVRNPQYEGTVTYRPS